jgi:hypothetical protein
VLTNHGVWGAKNLKGRVLRLIQIFLTPPSLKKPRRPVKTILTASVNRRFQFNKRAELFVAVHKETFCVAAMCVSNPD